MKEEKKRIEEEKMKMVEKDEAKKKSSYGITKNKRTGRWE